MSHPCRTKTQVGDILSWNRPFLAHNCNLKASWSETHSQKLLYRVGRVLKFHQDPFNPSKVIQLFSHDRHTVRQTCPAIHMWMCDTFIPFLVLSLHYICFTQLIQKRINCSMGTHPFWPKYFGPYPKFKIQLSILVSPVLRFPKRYFTSL